MKKLVFAAAVSFLIPGLAFAQAHNPQGTGTSAGHRGTATQTVPSVSVFYPNCPFSIQDFTNASNCISASTVPTENMLYPLTQDLFVSPDHIVGIGTVMPTAPLTVNGYLNSIAGWGRNLELNAYAPNVLFHENQTNKYYRLGLFNGSYDFYFDRFDPNGNGLTTDMVIKNGNVGIGTTNPQQRLHLGAGDLGLDNDRSVRIRNTNGVFERVLSVSTGNLVAFGGLENATNGIQIFTAGSEKIRVTNTGNVGIGTATPVSKLDVNGDMRTKCLTITGGCDLAEPFEVMDAGIEPGMVVSIDADNEGKLKLARKSYDRTVAGVISGAGGVKSGLMLTQTGMLEGGYPVALTGRVYCWCDASYGAIKPGDLLTTSATLGHAMKVENANQASGAILGKAMSSLSEGKGLVLIVVTLQ